MRHTYDYGIIGNCSYTAHIHKDTRVSWLCWPRFDSSFIFGDLIAGEKGGEFSIKPLTGIRESHQRYIENTNVLVTEISCEEGRYRVTDLAPRFHQVDRYYKPLMLIRKIERLEGHPRITVKCQPVDEYGEIKPAITYGSNHIRFLEMKSHTRLTTNIPLPYIAESQSFVLDDTTSLALTYGPPLEAELANTVNAFLEKTTNYWRNWVKQAAIVDFYQREACFTQLRQ
jgi:GH15 family glucan-1,4-alpha-glucosidase